MTIRHNLSHGPAALAVSVIALLAAMACGGVGQGGIDASASGRHGWAAGLEQVPWDVRIEESDGYLEAPKILIKRTSEELAALLTDYRLFDYEFRKAIVGPRFIAAEQASDKFANRQVLGVSINGDHRAYAIHFIEGHEIVNDTVGGVPVAVTY